MFFRISAGLSIFATLLFGDVLTLHSGRTVRGQYLGGDSRQIRMAVGDRVETFGIEDVSSLQFKPEPKNYSESSTPFEAQPPAPPSPPPAAAPPPAPEPAILRPERRYNEAPRAASYGRELPAGATLVVRMIDGVDSDRDRMGQTFRAALDEPVLVNGETLIPRGADVVAKLVDDKQSGRFEGRAVLTLDLQSILVDGRMVDINTGDVSQASASRGGRTAKVVGGTSALGAIIGAIAGGGKGAAIGAASGAAVGGGVQVLTKGQRVRIPSETRLTFTLQQPTRL